MQTVAPEEESATLDVGHNNYRLKIKTQLPISDPRLQCFIPESLQQPPLSLSLSTSDCVVLLPFGNTRTIRIYMKIRNEKVCAHTKTKKEAGQKFY